MSSIYDYGYTNPYISSGDGFSLFGASIAVIIILSILSLAISVFSIITAWKVFEKANKPGWASIVPFYNLYILCEITWGKGLYFLIFFASIIPVVGYIAAGIFSILTMIKLSKAFNQDTGFAVGLIFLPVIFMAILAFDKNKEYAGVPDQYGGMQSYGTPDYQNSNSDPIVVKPQEETSNVINETVNETQEQTNTMNTTVTNPTIDSPSQTTEQPTTLQQDIPTNPTPSASRCPNCGKELSEVAAFCPNCGTPKAS